MIILKIVFLNQSLIYIIINEIISGKCFKLSLHEELNRNQNYELTIAKDLILENMEKYNELKALIGRFNLYLKNIKVYIGSFTENSNHSNNLREYGSQWLCFRKSFIDKLQSDYVMMISRVEYDPTRQKEIIGKMFDYWVKLQIWGKSELRQILD